MSSPRTTNNQIRGPRIDSSNTPQAIAFLKHDLLQTLVSAETDIVLDRQCSDDDEILSFLADVNSLRQKSSSKEKQILRQKLANASGFSGFSRGVGPSGVPSSRLTNGAVLGVPSSNVAGAGLVLGTNSLDPLQK